MSRSSRVLAPAFVCLTLALSGCATNQLPSRDKTDASSVISMSMQEVDRLSENGGHKDAVKMLNDLTVRYPDRKEPWARLAKLHFDSGEYARAVIAAEEAVQRDATDRSVKTIRAVSGLRIAAQSLHDLRGDIELKGDAKADAVGLVKVMRETLGEEILVPQDDKKKKSAPVPVVKPKAKSSAAAPVTAAPANAGNAASGGSGNPFGALK